MFSCSTPRASKTAAPMSLLRLPNELLLLIAAELQPPPDPECTSPNHSEICSVFTNSHHPSLSSRRDLSCFSRTCRLLHIFATQLLHTTISGSSHSADELLLWAINYDRPATASLALQHGANVKNRWHPRHEGNCFLGHAILHNRIDIAALLLAYGADPIGPWNPLSPLHYAVTAGNIDAILLLQANGGMHERGRYTPLSIAAGKGYIDIVRILLYAGADPDSRTYHSQIWQTSLHTAVEAGEARIVELLLGAGAGVDLRDENGRTPLMRALYGTVRKEDCRQDVVRVLRRFGAEEPSGGSGLGGGKWLGKKVQCTIS